MNLSNSGIVLMENEDVKDIKGELRFLSDCLIRLESKFEAHIEADVNYHMREAQYFKDFTVKLDQ